jgi:sterol desaturase/sphingolipid hydroxylase (fatty acid hydroxylase superfamily)
MDDPRQSILLLISLPLYTILIGIEIVLSFVHNKSYYTLKDTLTNVYLTSLNFGLEIIVRFVCLGVLGFFYQFHFFEIENDWAYWILLLILQDIAFYFEHRIDHFCRFFWAVHVTHHSSDYFNLTTGFRSSVLQPLYRYIYFIPLSLFGFKSLDIMLMYSATQIYGILIHTKFIGKLGFLEYFMATPSHHRVHHASNALFLDKNMGMVFIVWDKIFGTFASEDDLKNQELQYGLTKKLESPNHPINIVFHEWRDIANDLKKDIPLGTKLKYVFMPPGWSHDGSRKTSRQLREELKSLRVARKKELA